MLEIYTIYWICLFIFSKAFCRMVVEICSNTILIQPTKLPLQTTLMYWLMLHIGSQNTESHDEIHNFHDVMLPPTKWVQTECTLTFQTPYIRPHKICTFFLLPKLSIYAIICVKKNSDLFCLTETNHIPTFLFNKIDSDYIKWHSEMWHPSSYATVFSKSKFLERIL